MRHMIRLACLLGVYSKHVKLWLQVVSKNMHRKEIGDLGMCSPKIRDEILRQSPYVY